MALVTVTDAAGTRSDGLDGALHMPARGPWWAKLQVDTATAPTGKVTLAFDGGLSLKGCVTVGGVFCDVGHVQVVGGAGGLGKILTPAAWQNAQLRDPLNAVLSQAGESLSSTVASDVLAVSLSTWTVVASTTARALDELCGAAVQALGKAITWRTLSDGSIWMGAESWPSQSMPSGSDVLSFLPAETRYILGVEAPWLAPGVNVSGIGNVAAVDHYFDSHTVRTWAWPA